MLCLMCVTRMFVMFDVCDKDVHVMFDVCDKDVSVMFDVCDKNVHNYLMCVAAMFIFTL